jgi:hypothetical protein
MKVGDLARTRRNLNGSRFFPEGTPCLILGQAQTDEGREFECVSVMIDGAIEDIYPGNLELLDETR